MSYEGVRRDGARGDNPERSCRQGEEARINQMLASEVSLTEASISTPEQNELRSVPDNKLGQYLYLAVEEKRRCEEIDKLANAECVSAEIAKKIAERIVELGNTDESQQVKMIGPERVRELLEDFQISEKHWQKVTEAAEVRELLQAARALKARAIGLPSDASEVEIKARREELVKEREWRENVANLDLVGKVLKRLQQLREDPQGSTSALRKDGSVGLGHYTLMAPAALEKERPLEMEDPCKMYIWFNSSRFALGGALIGALALGLACRPIWAGIMLGAPLGVACALPIVFIGAVFFGVAFPTVLDNYRDRIIQKILDKMREDPYLKPALDELKARGIECGLGCEDRGSKLVITPYIPSKKA